MNDVKIEVNSICTERVAEIIKNSAVCVAESAKNAFMCDTEAFILERSIQSPIEALFYAAFCAVNNSADCLKFNSDQHPFIGDMEKLIAVPQYSVFNYRADFGVFYGIVSASMERGYSYDGRWVTVELDGHAFHDKNEKQRRYEKKRDREFQKVGLKIFRYTGSEIHKNPFNAAVEVISEVTRIQEDEIWDNLPEAMRCEKVFLGS